MCTPSLLGINNPPIRWPLYKLLDAVTLRILGRVCEGPWLRLGVAMISFNRLLGKVVDGIVGIRGVADSVGTADERLQGNVGDELSERSQTVPWVLVQETHGHIDRKSVV